MNRYRPPGKKREDFLVWLGRFVPGKGPHVAIEVARQAQVPLMLAGTIDRYVKASVSYFHDQIEPEIDHDQITYVGPVNVRQKGKFTQSRARVPQFHGMGGALRDGHDRSYGARLPGHFF